MFRRTRVTISPPLTSVRLVSGGPPTLTGPRHLTDPLRHGDHRP